MPKPRLSEERSAYWLSVLNSIMGDFYEKRFYATFPKIQEVFNRNIADIAAMYSSRSEKRVKLRFMCFGNSQYENVPFAIKLTDGEIHLAVFLPEIEKFAKEIRAEKHVFGKTDSIVRLALVVGILHELDHAALGVVGDVKNVEDILGGEGIVWAKTCKDTISVLIEEYYQELCNHDKTSYLSWVKSGRNADNQLWKDFICGWYSAGATERLNG